MYKQRKINYKGKQEYIWTFSPFLISFLLVLYIVRVYTRIFIKPEKAVAKNSKRALLTIMATTKIQDESDKESTTSSSLTMAENSTPRSWMSSTTNLSFSSSRRTSISTDTPYNFSNSHKPHKSNQIPWELIKKLRVKTGQIKLEHFRLLRRVGSGDIGNVYVCEIRNPILSNGWPENYTMSRGNFFFFMSFIGSCINAIHGKSRNFSTDD